jgi:hypothetical protein
MPLPVSPLLQAEFDSFLSSDHLSNNDPDVAQSTEPAATDPQYLGRSTFASNRHCSVIGGDETILMYGNDGWHSYNPELSSQGESANVLKLRTPPHNLKPSAIKPAEIDADISPLRLPPPIIKPFNQARCGLSKMCEGEDTAQWIDRPLSSPPAFGNGPGAGGSFHDSGLPASYSATDRDDSFSWLAGSIVPSSSIYKLSAREHDWHPSQEELQRVSRISRRLHSIALEGQSHATADDSGILTDPGFQGSVPGIGVENVDDESPPGSPVSISIPRCRPRSLWTIQECSNEGSTSYMRMRNPRDISGISSTYCGWKNEMTPSPSQAPCHAENPANSSQSLRIDIDGGNEPSSSMMESGTTMLRNHRGGVPEVGDEAEKADPEILDKSADNAGMVSKQALLTSPAWSGATIERLTTCNQASDPQRPQASSSPDPDWRIVPGSSAVGGGDRNLLLPTLEFGSFDTAWIDNIPKDCHSEC